MPENAEKISRRRFDPKFELGEIKWEVKNAPKGEQSALRRELMEKFREEFAFQKEGLAEIQYKIESVIIDDPDAPADDILDRVQAEVRKYRLGVEQERKIMNAVQSYAAKHLAIGRYVHLYRQRFPEESKGGERWQREFFRAVFGFYPEGKIELDVGPMTLYWKCYSFEDYARAFGDKEGAANSSGFHSRASELAGLGGTINVENSGLDKTASYFEGTKRHEEMHAIQDLMPLKGLSEKNLPEELSMSEEASEALRIAVRNESRFIYGRAADEILAHLKEGKKINEVTRIILNPKGSYDYFNDAETRSKIMRRVSGALREKYPELELSPSALERGIGDVREDYRWTVMRATDAVADIAEITKYSLPEKLVSILSAEPLDKWPRLADLLWERYIADMNSDERENLMEEMGSRGKGSIMYRLEKFLSRQRMKEEEK